MALQQTEMLTPPSCQEGFPHIEVNFCLPLFGSFLAGFQRDYEAAGNLYVLNWRFWKPYSHVLASD